MRRSADVLARTMTKEIQRSKTAIRAEGPEGQPVTDPATGNIAFPARALVYEGPALVSRPGRRQTTVIDRGGQREDWDRYNVSIPITAPELPRRTRITVTATNGVLPIGSVLYVDEPVLGSLVARRRYSCSWPEVVSP